MNLVAILAAAAGAYTFGAFWYGINAKRWMLAAGVSANEHGQPETGRTIVPYVVAALNVLVVSAMMQQFLKLAFITTAGSGLLVGLGMGLFIALPWIMTNHVYAGRPRSLIMIDGIYAVAGCAIIGLLLMLF